VAERYRRFAEREARGRSPLYERLALGVAGDRGLLELLERLPPAKQQPNLFFAAVQYLGGPQPDPGAFRSFVLDHADQVVATMAARQTQTNEVGRCALLLPLLAALPGPLALLESCVWPDQPHRLARLRAAVAVTSTDPPLVVRGDLLDQVGPMVAQAPAGATVVVFHAAVLVYLPPAGRRRFEALMAELPVVWLSAEGPGVVPALEARLGRAPMPGRSVFLVGRGPDRLLGLADPHGAWLRWLDAAPAGS
jgi:hypothetical protein